jgi:hypothetical protein
MEQRIEARIVELQQIRDAFVEDANRRVAMLDGGIAELRLLQETLRKEAPSAETPSSAEEQVR